MKLAPTRGPLRAQALRPAKVLEKRLKFLSFLLVFLSFSYPIFSQASLLIPSLTKDLTCYQPSKELEYIGIPGCQVKFYYRGKMVESKFNELGFRDIPPPAQAPKKGQKRILLVGASLLVSPFLTSENTPSAVIRKELKRKWPSLELFLMATSGYTHVHNLIQLNKLIKQYAPTHIVLYFSNHLASQDSIYWNSYSEHKNGVPIRIKELSEAISDKFWFFSNLIPYRFQNFFDLSIFMAHRLKVSIQAYFSPEHERGEIMFKETLYALKAMRNLATQNNANFLVSVDDLPQPNTFIVKYKRPVWLAKLFDFFTPKIEISSKDFLQLLSKENLQVVPYAVTNIKDADSLFIRGDFHYNEIGSKIISTKIAESLISSPNFRD